VGVRISLGALKGLQTRVCRRRGAAGGVAAARH
jgi:hypothetical protein